MAEEEFSHTHTHTHCSTHPHTPTALDPDEHRGGPNFRRQPGRSGDFRCGRCDGGAPEPMRVRALIQASLILVLFLSGSVSLEGAEGFGLDGGRFGPRRELCSRYGLGF